MNPQLPAYLQNIGTPGLAARAAEGIGSALPPHISIRGNQFTMVDSAGNKQTAQMTFLDVCVADISDVMCKQYYDGVWTPDSADPPACWSANGIAPSIEAINPQSPRCDTCEWNKRGSDVAMDGKTQIKACRDEKWLAVLVPGIAIPLQLKLTPGSFKNWRGYVEMFRGKPIDLCHIFTRLQFEQNKNGVLTFSLSPAGYIDQATVEMFTRVKDAKASDALVGRNDRPRLTQGGTSGAIGNAGTGQTPLLVQPALAGTSTMQDQGSPAAGGQPQGFQPGAFGAAPAGTQSAPTQTGVQNASLTGTAQAEAPRRRRRTQAQIAADTAAAGGSAFGAQARTTTVPAPAFATQTTQPAGGQIAPFAQQPGGAPAGTATGGFGAAPTGQGGGTFGIATNAPPPPAGLDNALDALFGPAGGGQ